MAESNRNDQTGGSQPEPLPAKVKPAPHGESEPVQLQLGRLSEQAPPEDNAESWHQKKTGQLSRIRERR